MKNALLLSAGRRVELARDFIAEIRKRDPGAKLLAVDLRPENSAACRVADECFAAPRVTDPAYIEFLIQLSRMKNVGLIVPTIDTELINLAKHRGLFDKEGIRLAVSDYELVFRCRDKRKAAGLFNEINMGTPGILDKGSLRFPCFVKPHDGSCSIGAMRVESEDQLTNSLLADKKMMFMELIGSDYREYTVDTYFDRNHRLRCVVPRERLEVRAGEVSKGVTRRDHVYEHLLPRLQRLHGARGCITLQLFFREQPVDFKGLEINPRFGGGYPLSYAAGANFVGWLLDEYLLEKDIPFFDDWESNLLMLRYDAKVLVHDSP